MLYSYKAYDGTGELISGTLEAENLDAANFALLEQELIPESVKEGKGKTNGKKSGMSFGKLKPQELILFTKQFRTLFQAGISIVELLRILAEQTESKKFKQIILEIHDDVQEGASLHKAFSKHKSVFSPLYCSMLHAGETSGSLPEVMDRLSYLLDHEHKVKQDIKSALQYPIIVLVALGIAFFVLLTSVIPKFINIFEAAGIDIPLPTKICMILYSFLATYWYLCIAFVVLGVGGIMFYVRTQQGKYVRDSFFLTLPILGPVFEKAAMSRFASIFAILQASGVSVLNSIDILSAAIGNCAISKEFQELKEKLKQGAGIARPLKEAKYFPPMVVNMISIGEETGNLEKMLQDVSKHYDEEVAYAVSKMATNLGPALMVGLAAVVGFFALAIFLPMWDMTKMV